MTVNIPQLNALQVTIVIVSLHCNGTLRQGWKSGLHASLCTFYYLSYLLSPPLLGMVAALCIHMLIYIAQRSACSPDLALSLLLKHFSSQCCVKQCFPSPLIG